MNKACKLVAVLGVMWAAFVPAYLWYRDIRDEQLRKLRALAAIRLGAAADEYATNDTVRIPKGSVELVRDLAQAEERRSTMFTTIAWTSSGVILMLSLCALNAKQKDRDTLAEQDGPANGSQPIRSETNRTSSAAGSRR